MDTDVESLRFDAWREDEAPPGGMPGRRYVTVNELLVRLGSFGLGLTWRVSCDDGWERLAEIEKRAETGVGTLELLALLPAALQAVDGDFVGYRGAERVLVLREFDSTSWELLTADPWVLGEIRRCFPDAEPLAMELWEKAPWWEEPLPEGWGDGRRPPDRDPRPRRGRALATGSGRWRRG
ncbi:hypothetical protein ABT095_07280 [Kitasatospora sp. NPDC002227]|uniref:hypothetical protein n=1 Tax=Kitasatospora sp. NPDC002227 TaxID=3154773 RepID=UPI0033217C28